MTDVELHARLVRRRDEAVRPAALARDVKIHVFTFGVNHPFRLLRACVTQRRFDPSRGRSSFAMKHHVFRVVEVGRRPKGKGVFLTVYTYITNQTQMSDPIPIPRCPFDTHTHVIYLPLNIPLVRSRENATQSINKKMHSRRRDRKKRASPSSPRRQSEERRRRTMSAALSFSASVSGARVAVKVRPRRRRRERASVHGDGRDLNARETGDARRPRTSRGREIRPGMVRVDNAKARGLRACASTSACTIWGSLGTTRLTKRGYFDAKCTGRKESERCPRGAARGEPGCGACARVDFDSSLQPRGCGTLFRARSRRSPKEDRGRRFLRAKRAR